MRRWRSIYLLQVSYFDVEGSYCWLFHWISAVCQDKKVGQLKSYDLGDYFRFYFIFCSGFLSPSFSKFNNNYKNYLKASNRPSKATPTQLSTPYQPPSQFFENSEPQIPVNQLTLEKNNTWDRTVWKTPVKTSVLTQKLRKHHWGNSGATGALRRTLWRKGVIPGGGRCALNWERLDWYPMWSSHVA